VLRCGSLTGLLGCSGTARQRDSLNIARGLAAHTWQTSVVRGFGAHLNTLRVFFPVLSFSWSSECLPALLNPLAEWPSLSHVRRGSPTCGSTTPKKTQLLPGHVLPTPPGLAPLQRQPVLPSRTRSAPAPTRARQGQGYYKYNSRGLQGDMGAERFLPTSHRKMLEIY
jgi:hypothetical protein